MHDKSEREHASLEVSRAALPRAVKRVTRNNNFIVGDREEKRLFRVPSSSLFLSRSSSIAVSLSFSFIFIIFISPGHSRNYLRKREHFDESKEQSDEGIDE